MQQNNSIVHNELIPFDATFTFHIDENTTNMRIDQFIVQQFPLYSRSFFQQLIDNERITINNKTIKKSGIRVKLNDTIVITFPSHKTVEHATILEKNFDIKIVYEHDHFLILHKSAGVIMHAPLRNSPVITLVDWILTNYAEISKIGCIDRPGIVHRLDKNTSGLLIIARTNYAHTVFSDLFKARKITKTYIACVQGHPDKSGTISLPIARDPINKIKMIAVSQSNQRSIPIHTVRDATTHYEVMHYFDTYSLVKIKPITGRTHQIRAHFSAIGHPLVGDSVYGGNTKLIDRHALHAQNLSFIFDEQEFSFSSEIPADMQSLID